MFINKSAVGSTFLFLLIFISSTVSAQSELPHFFPEGVIQTNSPAKQWIEWRRYVNASKQALADSNGNWPGFVMGSDTIILERTYFGQKTKLVFSNHICEGKMSGQTCNGKIRYTSFEAQKYITQHQFDVLVRMTDDFANRAVKFDYEFWGPLEELAVSAVAQGEKKSVDEFRSNLDKEDPQNPDVTFRELRQIPPKLEEKDFVPFREINVGLTPDYPEVLGVAYLNAGIVYYTPMAMIRDYLTRTPLVLAHEFVHANKKLQGLPIVWGFDAETMASIPDMLDQDDHLDLPFHSYARDFREYVEVFTGLKFETAFESIIKRDWWMSMGNVVIDEEEFNRVSTLLNKVKAEFMVAFKKVVVEFYRDRIFWTAMNDKTYDDNFVFRVMMASMYNMTLLGGETATMKWLESKKYEVQSMMNKAWEESGKESKETSDGGMLSLNRNNRDQRIPTVFLRGIQQKYGVSDEQVQKFLKTHKITSVNQLFDWDPDRLKKAIQDFVAKEARTRRVQ